MVGAHSAFDQLAHMWQLSLRKELIDEFLIRVKNPSTSGTEVRVRSVCLRPEYQPYDAKNSICST